MTVSPNVATRGLLAFLAGLLTTVLLLPAGVAHATSSGAASAAPIYRYDAPAGATTRPANTRPDSSETGSGPRAPTGVVHPISDGVSAAKGEKGLSWHWKTRPRPGADGGISKIGIERAGDDAISDRATAETDLTPRSLTRTIPRT